MFVSFCLNLAKKKGLKAQTEKYSYIRVVYEGEISWNQRHISATHDSDLDIKQMSIRQNKLRQKAI